MDWEPEEPVRKSRRLAGKGRRNFASMLQAAANQTEDDELVRYRGPARKSVLEIPEGEEGSTDIRTQPSTTQYQLPTPTDPYMVPYVNELLDQITMEDGQFRCILCDHSCLPFGSEGDLNDHLLATHVRRDADDLDANEPITLADDFYKCPFCDYQQRTKRQLHQHIYHHLTRSEGYRCSRCNYTFFHGTAVQCHVKSKMHQKNTVVSTEADDSEDVDYALKYGANFSREAVRFPHRVLASQINPKLVVGDQWPCLVCGDEMPNDSCEVVSHYFTHLEVMPLIDEIGQDVAYAIFRCPICYDYQVRPNNPATMEFHIKAHFNLRGYECSLCKTSYPSAPVARDHLMSQDHVKMAQDLGLEIGAATDFASIVSFLPIRVPQLRQLQLISNRRKDKDMPSVLLDRPLKQSRPAPVVQPTVLDQYQFTCTLCEEDIEPETPQARLDHYYGHIQDLADGQLYGCCICGYRNEHSFNVRNHLVAHLGMKAYDCGICGVRFLTRPGFKAHCTSKAHLANLKVVDVDAKKEASIGRVKAGSEAEETKLRDLEKLFEVKGEKIRNGNATVEESALDEDGALDLSQVDLAGSVLPTALPADDQTSAADDAIEAEVVAQLRAHKLTVNDVKFKVSVAIGTGEPQMDGDREMTTSCTAAEWRNNRGIVKQFECPRQSCDAQFTLFKSLVDHMIRNHTTVEAGYITEGGAREYMIIQCRVADDCIYRTHNKNAYFSHLKSHLDPMMPFRCRVCNLQTFKKVRFEEHFTGDEHRAAREELLAQRMAAAAAEVQDDVGQDDSATVTIETGVGQVGDDSMEIGQSLAEEQVVTTY